MNLNITITESNAARYFRCADRAAALINAGYIFKPFATEPTAFYVDSPAGAQYIVHLHIGAEFGPSCDCPDWKKNQDFCKHILCAAELYREDDAAMWNAICEEVDARAAYEVA